MKERIVCCVLGKGPQMAPSLTLSHEVGEGIADSLPLQAGGGLGRGLAND